MTILELAYVVADRQLQDFIQHVSVLRWLALTATNPFPASEGLQRVLVLRSRLQVFPALLTCVICVLPCLIVGKRVSQAIVHVQNIKCVWVQIRVPIEATNLVPVNLLTVLRLARVLERFLQTPPSPRASNVFCCRMSLPIQTQDLHMIRRTKLSICAWSRTARQRQMMIPAVSVIILVVNHGPVFPLRLLTDICQRDFGLSLVVRPKVLRQAVWVWTQGEERVVAPEPGFIIDEQDVELMHGAVGPAKRDLQHAVELVEG